MLYCSIKAESFERTLAVYIKTWIVMSRKILISTQTLDVHNYTTYLVLLLLLLLVWIEAYLHSTVENHYRQAHLMTYWAPMAKCVMEATHQALSSGSAYFLLLYLPTYTSRSPFGNQLTACLLSTWLLLRTTYQWCSWKKVHFLWYMMMVLGVFKTEPEGWMSQARVCSGLVL